MHADYPRDQLAADVESALDGDAQDGLRFAYLDAQRPAHLQVIIRPIALEVAVVVLARAGWPGAHAGRMLA